MSQEFRSKVRSGKADLEDLENIFLELKKQDSEIDIPDTGDLFNQNIYTPPQHSGNVNINGVWMHKLFQRIMNQLADGESPVIIICGKPGKGKSYTALSIAHTLHNTINACRGDFDPEKQTVYKVLDFLFFIRDATRQVVMFDEAADTLSKNTYSSPFNSAVASTINTQRKRQNVYIFVSKAVNALDPRIVEDRDIVIELDSKQTAKVRSYKRKHAKVSKKGKGYQQAYFGKWDVPDVPKDLAKKYDEIDNSFKGSFLDDLLLKLLKKRMEELQEENTATL